MQGYAESGAGEQLGISIELVIETSNPSEAEALLRAIRPDNRTAPPWLSIEEKRVGDKLVISISSRIDEAKRIGSVRNTVDEILEYVYSLLKTIEETAKTLKQAG